MRCTVAGSRLLPCIVVRNAATVSAVSESIPLSDRQLGDQTRKLLGHLMWNINCPQGLEVLVGDGDVQIEIGPLVCFAATDGTTQPGGRHADIRAQQLNNPR